MDQLLKNKEFQAKMASLCPEVKHWFINALVDLFEQESEYVIDVLEDCRYELGRTAESYSEDAEELRAASRMLEERRDYELSESSGRSSALSSLGENNGPTRRRERQQRMCISDWDGRSPSSLSVLDYSTADRPLSSSARATRNLLLTPQPPSASNLEKETQALLRSMTDADAQVERERERQQERLERIRRQKKLLSQDRTAQAMKLLEKALEMDRVLAEDKARQGKMLQDKLQDLKKRRSNIQSTPLSQN